MEHAAFLSAAWTTILRALVAAGVQAHLNHKPAMIRKSVKRRCITELKRLTLLIRRLIFLMALSVELAPLVPCEGRNWFREEEDKPAPRRRGLCLTPAACGSFTWSINGLGAAPRPGPVPAAPVVAKWTTLLHVLMNRERRAKCLARTLARWRASGEPGPYILPMARTHRMRADLGLIATALPMLLNKALVRWPDTG